jgi:hypothetical protein
MANKLTGSVWYLDSTGVVVSSKKRISSFLVSPTNTAWEVVINDTDGNPVLSVKGVAADPIAIPANCNVLGITVATLTNATVTIYG